MAISKPIRITADEVNCLIYSYFQDSGLKHSAFTILNEGRIQNSPYLARHIPRGELINLLGKALLYLEVESHWQPDAMTAKCTSGFSLLEPHVCCLEPLSSKLPASSAVPTPSAPSTDPPPSAKQQLPSSNSSPHLQNLPKTQAPHPPLFAVPVEYASTATKLPSTATSSQKQETTSAPSSSSLSVPEAGSKRKSSPVSFDVPNEKRQKTESPPGPPDDEAAVITSKALQVKKVKSKHRPQGPGDDITDPRSIRLLPGHNTEVFVCAWNPENPGLLSTGAKDSEVILWDLTKTAATATDYITDGHMLASLGKLSREIQGDLTCLHWSADGTLLAIGSYDSVLRVATHKGMIWMTSDIHEGPIFATRFSRKGHMLLTASLDGTACVWDVARKKLHRQYRTHKDCCLDVDWIDDKIFASAGADKRIMIMHIDQDEPLKILEGHGDEINQIRVNSTGTRLASCSDDSTARVWKTDRLSSATDAIPGLSSSENVVVLTGHTHAVSAICWCPPANLSKGHEIIATASFDTTANLWDSVTGECLATFTDHRRPVYTLTFSPDGRFLATGAGDGWLFVYNVNTSEKAWSWFAGAEKPGVFEIDWQIKDGYNRIALALEGRKVAVVDCQKIAALQVVEGHQMQPGESKSQFFEVYNRESMILSFV